MSLRSPALSSLPLLPPGGAQKIIPQRDYLLYQKGNQLCWLAELKLQCWEI